MLKSTKKIKKKKIERICALFVSRERMRECDDPPFLPENQKEEQEQQEETSQRNLLPT